MITATCGVISFCKIPQISVYDVHETTAHKYACGVQIEDL